MSKNIYCKIYNLYFIFWKKKINNFYSRLDNVKYVCTKYLHEITKYLDDEESIKYFNKYILKIKFSNNNIAKYHSYNNIYDFLYKLVSVNDIIFFNDLNYNLFILKNKRLI